MKRSTNWAGRITVWSLAGAMALSGAVAMADSSAATKPAAMTKQGHKAGMGNVGMARIQTALGTLTLTADQQKQTSTLISTFVAARKAWHAQHKDELLAVQSKLATARQAHDKAAVRDASAQVKALHADAPHVADLIANVRTSLTADQQTLFDAALATQPVAKHTKKNAIPVYHSGTGAPATPMTPATSTVTH